LAVDWQPSSRFMLRGVAPESLAARYRVVPWLSLGIEGAMEGERYHLTEATSGRDDAELAYSLIKAGVAATVHWNDWLHTRAYGGATLHRRFEIFLDDESQGDLRVEPGPYAGLELWLGPSGWKTDTTAAQAQAL
ncbi:MAG TPA: hypothetical protein VJR89_35845, partial [Polyangiales bacterium]|nr:hypothetical protein [Polyangiales bacterium]